MPKIHTIALLAIIVVCYGTLGSEAKSVEAARSHHNNWAQIKSDVINGIADAMISFVDNSLGRQARSLARGFFGIDDDVALKAFFVKMLEFCAFVIGELVFAPPTRFIR